MTTDPPRLLLVMQGRDASAGRCRRKLRERGYQPDYCYPQSGVPLPNGMDGYAGAMVFGGPMSANDDGKLPGIRAQLDWIPTVLDSGRPFLGICLGAQLLARTLGATVQPHPEGRAEIGYFPIRPTAAGAKLDAKELQFVAQIGKSSEFMLRLLEDLLDVSQIESGKLNLALAPVDLAALVDNNVALNRVLAAAKHIYAVFPLRVHKGRCRRCCTASPSSSSTSMPMDRSVTCASCASPQHPRLAPGCSR